MQSVALRVIVEREDEIRRFVPREYWRLRARLAPTSASSADAADGAASLLAEVTHVGGARLRQFDINTTQASAAVAALLPDAWAVSAVKRSRRQSAPPAPYNTASLQQDGSRRVRHRRSNTEHARGGATHRGYTPPSHTALASSYTLAPMLNSRVLDPLGCRLHSSAWAWAE